MRRARPSAIGLYDYLWPGRFAQGFRPRPFWGGAVFARFAVSFPRLRCGALARKRSRGAVDAVSGEHPLL